VHRELPGGTLKGAVISSTPKTLQIRFTENEPSSLVSIRIGLKTKFVPFRRPAVGENLVIEYGEEDGDKFGYVVRAVKD
jgi:hypothetical protein